MKIEAGDVDILFLLSGGNDDPEFRQMVENGMPYVREFEKLYGQKLVKVSATMEEGAFEPAYIFEDGFHYTLEGVLNSIKE